MKPQSMHQFQMSAKEASYAASFRRVNPCSIEDIREAAQEAVRLSMDRNFAASYLWADVVHGCEKLKISVPEIVFGETCFYKSLAERVIEAEDWLSSRIIAESLEDGIYAGGSIIKKGGVFSTHGSESGIEQGIITYQSGALYGGGIKNEKRHSFGVYDSAAGMTHYSDWFEDQRHGEGCTEIIYPKRVKKEGRFVDDALVKPKKQVNLWQSLKRPI